MTGVKITIESVPFLLENHVKLKNIDDIIEKLNLFKEGGAENLQVVTDYDQTITKHHDDGKPIPSSFGLLAECRSIPNDFLQKNSALRDKYHPIETDPHLTMDDKIPYMIQWYSESQGIFDGVPFNEKELEEAAHIHAKLRDGTNDFFRLLEQNKIPTLVFSAGLGDVIRIVLKENDILESELLHIVSNFFSLSDGRINNFTCRDNGFFLHPFNKNATGCPNYFKDVGHSRGNVIVMGDTIGDSQMSNGVPKLQNTIKIGFLYGTPDCITNSIPQFLNHFDIVLVDDQTMKVPQSILNLILPQSSQKYYSNAYIVTGRMSVR